MIRWLLLCIGFYTVALHAEYSQTNFRNPFQDVDSSMNEAIATQPAIKLTTELIHIHYANAENLARMLSDRTLDLISREGGIVADNHNHILYLHDSAKRLVQLKKFIAKLDIPTPQILIKAQIITADDNLMKNLGILFGTRPHRDSNEENTSSNTIRVPIFHFYDGTKLDMEIKALENEGHAKLISRPQLITLNRMPAIIESGEEIPYQESTYSGGTTISFRKAVLRLKVTPEIMPNRNLLLQLNVNQDKVSPLMIKGVPAISTQQLKTQVLVKDQQTIILGGIYEQENSLQHEGIPGLRKLPLVGMAFQRKHNITSRRELLIFITPKIIQP